MIALAVLSTAFTSQAIATGFERRYGVLKRLGSTPLSRSGLIGAKTVTVIARRAGPDGDPHRGGPGPRAGSRKPARAPRSGWPCWCSSGTAAFSGLALLLAGTLRAEATLALANLVYLVLLGIGGIIFPLTKFPAAAQPVLTLLPSGALSDGLHAVLQHGAGLPLATWRCWRCGPRRIALAARLFRWE